jgi:uncharacterized protein (DUF302 family)
MERRTLLRLLGVTAAAAAGCTAGDEDEATPTMSQTDTERRDRAGLVTVTVEEEEFEATVDRIEADIEAAGLTLLATVDHAANAASVDRELPPTTLFVFGNPDVGTPLMRAARSVAVDLPQKLLVWADGSAVRVSYNDPAYLADRHDIDGQDDRLEAVGDLLRRLATGEK